MKNKKQIMSKLSVLVNSNGGKYLKGRDTKRGDFDEYNRKKFFYYMRDREIDQSYFLIQVKGNYIRGWRIRFVNSDGNGINLYMELFIPTLVGEKQQIPITKKQLICKEPLSKYQEFIIKFINLTPSLEWF